MPDRMGSSLRRRANALWLAAVQFLLLLSLSLIQLDIGSNDWHGRFVDAASMHDGCSSLSVSSQSFRNRQRKQEGEGGYGSTTTTTTTNRNKTSRANLAQETNTKLQKRRQLPWLLVPIHTPTNAFQNDMALLRELRGGSNKSSEVGSKSTAVSVAANKDKRRSDKKQKKNAHKGKEKRKRKNKNKQKHKDDDDENDDDANEEEEEEAIGGGDDQIPKDKDAAIEKSSMMEEESTSRLFLVDPFRMNEIARYEASIAAESEKEEDDEEDDEAASEESASESEPEDSAAIESEEHPKSKQHNKKGKKQNHRKNPHTKERVEEELTADEQVESVVGNKDTLRKNKRKGKQRNNRKQAEISDVDVDVDVDDDEESIATTVDSTIESSEEDGGTDAADASEQSSSFWWVDVWTQQLSDPEDIMDEADETEETPIDIDGLPDVTVADADDKDNVKKTSKKGRKGKDLPSTIEEKSEESTTNPDDNASSVDAFDEIDTNVTNVAENETAASLTLDQNVTFELLEAPISYVSTGAWVLIDNMLTVGLASKFSSLRLSRKLRLLRKLSAKVTRMHGLLSGKPSAPLLVDVSNETATNITADTETVTVEGGEEPIEVIQKRIAAIEQAREGVERAQAEERAKRAKRNFWGFKPRDDVADLYRDPNETAAEEDATSGAQSEGFDSEVIEEEPKIPQKTPEEIEAEFQRMERVREIDQLIVEGQNRLAELICEKDVLQRRPNPLFNYTTKETTIIVEGEGESEENTTQKIEIQASRKMTFPPDDLVAEYLDMMISTRRLIKMNHTDLWQESEDEVYEGEDESIGDDLFTASADAHRLYQGSPSVSKNGNGANKNGKKGGGGGSWLLRQSIGGRRSFGEKIGELVETLAYKSVTNSLMSFLSRMISGLHGTNVLKHSDIRLFMEQSPDLPPIPKDGIIRGNHQSYAEETLKTVMRRKSRRSKKRSQASFVQQEAVTETLLSHVQISAPLLKLFPLAWQRALLGNIIALSCAIISDFLDGLHFQILGHQLSFAFRPITEVDMARHFQMAGGRFNKRRYKAAEFEAAVQATSEDLKEELKFLDSWHERALGSGVLRTQIANMIARIVLTLTDEVLSGARMDLWSTQAGGPRMIAGLEHRIEEDEDEADSS